MKIATTRGYECDVCRVRRPSSLEGGIPDGWVSIKLASIRIGNLARPLAAHVCSECFRKQAPGSDPSFTLAVTRSVRDEMEIRIVKTC